LTAVRDFTRVGNVLTNVLGSLLTLGQVDIAKGNILTGSLRGAVDANNREILRRSRSIIMVNINDIT
jgi:hypothetical protein